MAHSGAVRRRETTATAANRAADVRRALRLEWLTVAWMIVEAAVATGAGLRSRSLVLQAFGADSVIELVSAGVLVWRLRAELERGLEFPEAIERRAGRIGGALLFALSAYVAAGALRAAWLRQAQDFSPAGLLVTGAAIPLMAALARSKLRMADRLGSRALRADAMESLTCGYLSIVVFLAVLAQALVSAWWISPLGALALVPFLVREAREAWNHDSCGDCGASATDHA